jgi:hypothetical protein
LWAKVMSLLNKEMAEAMDTDELKDFLESVPPGIEVAGIGGVVYYRRVIESRKNRIFDEVIRVLEKISASDTLLLESLMTVSLTSALGGRIAKSQIARFETEKIDLAEYRIRAERRSVAPSSPFCPTLALSLLSSSETPKSARP